MWRRDHLDLCGPAFLQIDATGRGDMAFGALEAARDCGFIPGASASTTNLTHTVQQELAKLYGAAATDLAKKLAVDIGMSGPNKVFAITKALVAAAQRDGFKGDLKILGDVALDVAQAAYRAIEPNIGSDTIALASALTANPLVAVAAELVAPAVQRPTTDSQMCRQSQPPPPVSNRPD